MALKNIAILDYNSGNLHSISNCFMHLGAPAKVITTSEELLESDGLVLPGVGAFGDAMANLREKGLDQAIKKFHSEGKPILGICLGLQILFQESEEFGKTEGLGLVNGRVKSFAHLEPKVRVPNVGWYKNLWRETSSKMQKVCRDVSEKDFYYFVHSFYVEPTDEGVILSEAIYGNHRFCSGISSDNLTAFQFHPEKSGKPGLQIIKNWIQN